MAHKTLRLARILLERKLGRPLKGHALHKCDTPACLEERHLFEGTHTENMKDMARKGRTGGCRAKSLA
jgi:hypothetical protein